ncbi:MAG: hypothetical protein ACYDAZ_02445 [Thermoplasmataceae archaeon]
MNSNNAEIPIRIPTVPSWANQLLLSNRDRELRKGTAITYEYEGKETVYGILRQYVSLWR